jgi:hypothetical protein
MHDPIEELLSRILRGEDGPSSDPRMHLKPHEQKETARLARNMIESAMRNANVYCMECVSKVALHIIVDAMIDHAERPKTWEGTNPREMGGANAAQAAQIVRDMVDKLSGIAARLDREAARDNVRRILEDPTHEREAREVFDENRRNKRKSILD